jgi:autotransporter-associated beta strand protein
MLGRSMRINILTATFYFIFLNGLLYADDWAPTWTSAQLSQARHIGAAVTADGKVFFPGGSTDNGAASNVMDIYDAATNSWSTEQLPHPRGAFATTSSDGKLFIGGGYSNGQLSDIVDIYDIDSKLWTQTNLSRARYMLAAASAGGKVLFSGGYDFNIVDIYDTGGNSWSTTHLSQFRNQVVGVSSGNKVFFAGGYSGYYPDQASSSVVDIFNTANNSWTTASLSEARSGIGGVSCDNIVFFAGGWIPEGDNVYYTNRVDIYNTTTNSWSTAGLSQAASFVAAAAARHKVFFGGGYGTYTNVVDIYDTVSSTWSKITLSQSKNFSALGSVGNKVLFAGNTDNNTGLPTNIVNIYTIQDYDAITSSKPFTLVDKTTVRARMQLNTGASLNLDGYDLAVGSMAGSALIGLSTHTLTTGSDNTDSTYSGSISGNGAIVKTGSGALSLSGSNSYLGMTTVNMGELDLVGQDAWNPIMNLGGAFLSGGDLIFDYDGSTDPYATIMGLMGTKITGSLPLYVTDDGSNSRVIVSAVPEPSTITFIGVGVLGLLAYAWRRCRD